MSLAPGDRHALLRKFLLRFGSLADYKADVERYRSERDAALAAGFDPAHPCVSIWVRRERTCQRVIQVLEDEDG